MENTVQTHAVCTVTTLVHLPRADNAPLHSDHLHKCTALDFYISKRQDRGVGFQMFKRRRKCIKRRESFAMKRSLPHPPGINTRNAGTSNQKASASLPQFSPSPNNHLAQIY